MKIVVSNKNFYKTIDRVKDKNPIIKFGCFEEQRHANRRFDYISFEIGEPEPILMIVECRQYDARGIDMTHLLERLKILSAICKLLPEQPIVLAFEVTGEYQDGTQDISIHICEAVI